MNLLKPKQLTDWPDTFHWWIDAVGGYLVFTKPNIRIGQAGNDQNDIAILADISAHHADLRIDESGTLLLASSETKVNGVAENGFILKDGDQLKLRSVEMQYHRPMKWSSTARIDITSRHRLPAALDGIVMLGQTCVLGHGHDAHIKTPWQAPVFVNWHRNTYWVRGPGPLIIDGRKYKDEGPLTPTSHVEGPWGAFHWEPF